MSFMQTSNALKNNPFKGSESTNPLEALAARVDPHMRRVNEIILENMQSDVPLIPQLARYLIAAGGKRIRPLLTLASAEIFNAPMDKTYYLAAAVEFIHSATLLHDDVVDESHERRGQQSANVIFGNQASVLVGDFLFSKSFQLMVEARSLDILRILSNAAAVIAQGEVLQLATTNDISTSQDAYMRVIESKTAALFAAACEIGPVLAGAPQEQISAIRDYGSHIGIAFQITDDTLDYSADQALLGKDIGDDFKEGKMTAPIIFALKNATADERDFWQRVIGEKQQDDGDFESALKLIEKYNALEASEALARAHAAKAKDSLRALPAGEMTEILAQIADYTVARRY